MGLLTALFKFGARLMVRVRRERHERDFRDPQDDFSWNEVPPWAIRIVDKQDLTLRLLQRVLSQQENIMGTYKDLGDAIARNTNASDSILAMLQDVVQKLKDAQAANDPAAIDAAIQHLDANTNRLAAAAVKNTVVDQTPPNQPLPPPAPVAVPEPASPNTDQPTGQPT